MEEKYNVEELLDKIGELELEIEELKDMIESIGKKEEKKKVSTWVWVLAIIGAVAAVAAIAYAVYRYFTPDYLEDFEDDFEVDEEDSLEDDDDDIFEDEGDFY